MSETESEASGAAQPDGGKWDLASLKLTPATPLQKERAAAEEFARRDAAVAYREPLDHLYAKWHEYDEGYFSRRLIVPHIGLGPNPPRRLSQCRLATNNGGQMEIVLPERAVFGPENGTFLRLWPAPGVIRFLEDLLLAETVKQFVMEVHGDLETGYGGHGPKYVAEANRINEFIGLRGVEVRTRRRGIRGHGQPVAALWPWAFREEGYYLGDVRLDHQSVPHPITTREAVIPGLFDYLLLLASTNQVAR